MIRIALFLLLVSVVSGQSQTKPADFAYMIKMLEGSVAADTANLGLKSQLVIQYNRAQSEPGLAEFKEVARKRVLETLLEMIQQDPGLQSTGRLSQLSFHWRDANYRTLRSVWLAAASNDPANRAVQLAAATSLWPSVDHQEILRLLGKPESQSDLTRQAEVLAAAFVFGDPAQSSAAQSKLSALANPDQLRTAGFAAARSVELLRADPLWKTEDLERLESFAGDLVRRAGPYPVRPQNAQGSGGSARSPMLIKRVEPSLPAEAAKAHVYGPVKFTAVIGGDGRIESLQPVSGHPLLIQAASKAVRQWEYRPTFLNGQPVKVTTEIEVNFKPL